MAEIHVVDVPFCPGRKPSLFLQLALQCSQDAGLSRVWTGFTRRQVVHFKNLLTPLVLGAHKDNRLHKEKNYQRVIWV